eukprot:scaffold4424_cov113-Isochrysis_galbana.AAC.5
MCRRAPIPTIACPCVRRAPCARARPPAHLILSHRGTARYHRPSITPHHKFNSYSYQHTHHSTQYDPTERPRSAPQNRTEPHTGSDERRRENKREIHGAVASREGALPRRCLRKAPSELSAERETPPPPQSQNLGLERRLAVYLESSRTTIPRFRCTSFFWITHSRVLTLALPSLRPYDLRPGLWRESLRTECGCAAEAPAPACSTPCACGIEKDGSGGPANRTRKYFLALEECGKSTTRPPPNPARMALAVMSWSCSPSCG